MKTILGCLAVLSLGLMLWQWCVAWRFPLHRRVKATAFFPAVTLLKPLKGCDEMTEDCLRSWLAQEYAGPRQVLFGVADADDPVCQVVRRLLKEFPDAEAQLVVCGPPVGTNLKVSKLVELERLVRHELVVISDADVKAPPDCLANMAAPLAEAEVGLVSCFYRLANSPTLPMRWEATAANADFWSQVLQARSLKPLDFALGAVMATRRRQLAEIGGFQALADCLADDYQLGRRIARRGYRLELSPLVVECWSAPTGWAAVWKHQLRWARTIRVCQPAPYFLSILSNPTLWPLLYLAVNPTGPVLLFSLACWTARIAMALDLQARLEGSPQSTVHSLPAGASAQAGPQSKVGSREVGGWGRLGGGWLALLKDLLQAAIWLLAFTGSSIEWRDRRMRLRRDGTMVPK
ncbi:MAG TPA: glycosyltransferase [Dongiaceae bacterium]|nr:glycosyltransferase [Dongiaceae bacterium]